MHAGHHLAASFPLSAPLLRFGELAVRSRQDGFFFPEETRIVDVLSGRKIRKRLETYINAGLLIRLGQGFRLFVGFHGDADKPLPGGGSFWMVSPTTK